MEKKAKKIEVSQLMGRVRDAQAQLKSMLQNGGWMADARTYVERQRREMRKLIHGDIEKVRKFVERERQELERLQKQIPAEVSRWKKYLASQRKELEKVLAGVGTKGKSGKKKPAKVTKKKTTRKKAASSKKSPVTGVSTQ